MKDNIEKTIVEDVAKPVRKEPLTRRNFTNYSFVTRLMVQSVLKMSTTRVRVGLGSSNLSSKHFITTKAIEKAWSATLIFTIQNL